jgi:hypothetical protein
MFVWLWQYFTLLAHMLEVYPEKVAKLSQEGFGRIVDTLDFGLRHQVMVLLVSRVSDFLLRPSLVH